MKTVERLLIAAGIVFTAVLLTNACKDDDKDDQTTIIGTWQLVESKADVKRVANATDTEENLEAAIVNYIKVPINSRVSFSNTQLTLVYSINEGENKSATCDYTLNDGTLSIVLPIDSPHTLLGSVDLKDNTLKVTLNSSSYLSLLQYFAGKDAAFKAKVDQIAEASIYFRLKR